MQIFIIQFRDRKSDLPILTLDIEVIEKVLTFSFYFFEVVKLSNLWDNYLNKRKIDFKITFKHFNQHFFFSNRLICTWAK